jgi:NADH dehydrogenase
MDIRRVCIFGGSGFVGRHIVHLLSAAGYIVRVPTRNRERAKELIVLPTVDVIQSDTQDPSEINRLCANMDAVINLAGIRYETKKSSFKTTHIELPKKIIDACLHNHVPRFLHMSSLAAKPDSKSAYAQSKAEGEKLVLQLTKNSAIKTTVFRPSVIFGPGDDFLNLFDRLLRVFPILPLANYKARFQPVFVEDVAQTFVQSLPLCDTFNQVYNLCGPKAYTLREIVDSIGKTQHRSSQIINLGNALSFLMAAVMERLPGKILTRSDYYSMQDDNTCSGTFPSVFNLSPTSMEAVLSAQALQNSEAKYSLFRHTAHRKTK